MNICAIVPSLNPDEKLKSVVEGLLEQGFFKVLLVDDGSADDTAVYAQKAGATVIRHMQNKGLGMAFRSAVDYAIEHGYDLMVNMDGDGQFNADNIARLIAPILNHHT